MKNNLVMSEKEVDEFGATFYTSAAWGRPVKRLKNAERFHFCGLMAPEKFTAFWKKISTSRKHEPTKLWEELQEALNKDCRALFLSGDVKVYIALDDDKIRFMFSKQALRNDKDFLFGAKPCQHTKSNRRGFTIDTAASSATGFPYHFSVLRQGVNNTQNYENMVKYMFGHRFACAAAMAQALYGLKFCSDRGYWTAPLMIALLSLGATLLGTLKRCEWVPYTYDQKLSANDKREKIETKYGRSLFSACARWHQYLVKVLAWRGGTGSVSLAMTSDCDDNETQEFDFCFQHNADARWYKDSNFTEQDRHLKAFTGSLREGEPTDQLSKDIKNHLTSLMFDVLMLNTSDIGVAWFVLRMFSFTSSASEATLRRTAPFIPTTSYAYLSFERVLAYASLSRHLNKESAIEDDSDSSNSDCFVIDSPLIKFIVKSMRAPSQKTANNCAKSAKQIVQEIQTNAITPATMELIMVTLGFSRDRAGAGMSDEDKKKKVTKWLRSVTSAATVSTDEEDSSSDQDMSDSRSLPETIAYDFPYDIFSANEVKDLLRTRVGSTAITTGRVPGPIPHPTKVDERRTVLRWLDKNPQHIILHEQQGEDNNLRDAVLSGVVPRSFLRSLEGKEKAAMKLGHQNEANYLRQYFEDSKAGKVPDVNIVDVMRCGLAMKQGEMFVRDTADGIAFEQREPAEDGENCFDPISSHMIECKCRSGSGSDGSLKKAEAIQKKIVDLKGDSAYIEVATGSAVYLRLSSQEKDLIEELIPCPSERIQTLHHAYTYGRQTVTFLVGDPHGRILYGLIITFDPELLKSYGEALKYLHDNGLNVFYADDIEEVPLDFIEGILSNSPGLSSKFDINDFMTSLHIWRQLLPGRSYSPKFPVPNCWGLLPLEHSLWNSCKGGSDTITRFMANCKPSLPIRTPQTVIVSRYLMLRAVLFHRLLQSTTMRKKVDVYSDTIKNVRDRNNQRYSFEKSLEVLAEGLLRRSKTGKQ